MIIWTIDILEVAGTVIGLAFVVAYAIYVWFFRD